MCEDATIKIPGWKGWLDVPAPKISGAAGPWIDLSHRLTEELSRIPAFPQPQIRRLWKIPEHRANVTEVHMVVHHGTHLDAPRHFIADGPAMDEVPLDRLYGQGVVWRFDADDDGMIDVADLERATPRLRPGDIALLDTGRAKPRPGWSGRAPSSSASIPPRPICRPAGGRRISPSRCTTHCSAKGC